MQIIGQKHILEIIDRWSLMPNFTIIQGDKHYGKTYLVLYLCKKFNLHYMKMSNSVKDIRGLVDSMVPNSNTVYHFQNFDNASVSAKNALLKITEEPVAGNYIVITGGPQIPTLQSRATRLVMEPYEYDEIQELMNTYYKAEITKKLYVAGINTPAKILQYKEFANIEKLMDCAYETFEGLTHLSGKDMIFLTQRFSDRYEEGKIDGCLLFLEMLINIIEDAIRYKKYFSYRSILDIVIQYKNKLLFDTTLRRRLIILRMLYDIRSSEGLVS